MPLIQVTLTANTVAVVPLDAPTGRVVVTVQANPAEVHVTADGTVPVVPSSGVEVATSQKTVAGVTGAQRTFTPPLFGSAAAWAAVNNTVNPAPVGTNMAVASIRLISSGTPTVSVEW